MTVPHPPDLGEAVRRAFREAFGRDPSRVVRAPGRVNLIGEHTDHSGGLCLPVALPHATYAAAAPRDDDVLRLHSTRAGRWEGRDLRAATGWAGYAAGTVWALRAAGVPVGGHDVLVDSSVPLGAGLSSSAALECAVGAAVAPDVAPDVLVAAGIRAEREVVGAPTGGMDQAVVVHARAGHALLLDFADGSRRHVACDLPAHGLALLAVDTRVRHDLADGGYADRRAACEAAATALGLPLRLVRAEDLPGLADPVLGRRARHVVTENQRVEDAVVALHAADWPLLGRLMDASHASLRDDFEVSCSELDTVVEAARAAGAVGARMTGGGFGGSAVVLVAESAVDAVVDAVRGASARRGFPEPAFLAAAPSAGVVALGGLS